MLKNYKNTSGNITGDYNTNIQIIVSEGKDIAEKLGVLIDGILEKDKKEKTLLEDKINTLERTLKDSDTIKSYLNKEIFQLKTDLANKEKLIQANEERYAAILLDLNGKDLTKTDQLYARAYEAFLEGNIQRAIEILSRQKLLEAKAKLDKEKAENAKAWLFKASLLESENQYTDELNECYEIAVEIYPSWSNYFEVVNYCIFTNQYSKANKYINYALLKSEGEFQKAATLNNLGILQRAKNEYKQAEISHKKALKIQRKLATENPLNYLHGVAMILNSLGILADKKNEYEQAEQNYKEALKILKGLAKDNLQSYLPGVAMIMNNLGVSQRNRGKFKQALASYKEVLEIRKKLAQVDPKTHLPDIAMALNNMGILQASIKDYEQALKSFEEALRIDRDLVELNPQTYLPHLATTLNNLGNLRRQKKEFKKAKEAFLEALELRRYFVANYDENTFILDLAQTLYNLSLIYYETENKQKAVETMREVVDILLPLAQKVPYTKPYLKKALKFLTGWGFDIESFLKNNSQ